MYKFCRVIFFFFSSRRRHTRSTRDWSSDVCSSDLRRFEPRNSVWKASTQCCPRSEEHTSELQSRVDLVCRLLLEKKKNKLSPEHVDDPITHWTAILTYALNL